MAPRVVECGRFLLYPQGLWTERFIFYFFLFFIIIAGNPWIGFLFWLCLHSRGPSRPAQRLNPVGFRRKQPSTTVSGSAFALRVPLYGIGCGKSSAYRSKLHRHGGLPHHEVTMPVWLHIGLFLARGLCKLFAQAVWCEKGSARLAPGIYQAFTRHPRHPRHSRLCQLQLSAAVQAHALVSERFANDAGAAQRSPWTLLPPA